MAVPRIEWRAAARRDLLAIIDFISDDKPIAAQRIKNEIEARVSRLPEYPRLYRAGRVTGTREMVVGPSYVVVYAENASVITILRILHGAQQWPPSE